MHDGGGNSLKNNNLTNFVFSYIFLILLSTPLCFCLFGHDVPLYLISEKRDLATAPSFKSTQIQDLPRRWDQYFKDRMPFRQVFMPGYIFTYEKLLKTYVSEYVTGKGDELFINHAAPVIRSALWLSPYREDLKEHLRLTAAGKHAYFMSKDIPFYLFIAPDKSTLYPELLPFYVKWIPHKTWYEEQVATLEKANIRFYQLNDFLRNFKDQGRLYDIIYDNGHWNGNALALAYKYMSRSLSKDNQIFRSVPYHEYYETENKDVTFSVYGSEKTTFIRLRHTNDFGCTLLPLQYRSAGYNVLCTNNKVPKGSLWFFSDSYFGGTHGSNAVTPFVHNVHTYIHRHYVPTKPFTQFADESLSFNRPDAVIDEYVERMSEQHELSQSKYDPLIRILGDFWMKTGGIFLDHKTALSKFIFNNVDYSDSNPDEFVIRPKNSLLLREPVSADDLGRVVVMGKIYAPANASIRISYWDENGTEKTQNFSIPKGTQIFHETIHVKPFCKVSLSMKFLTPGRYRLEKIQEIDDLRERM